MKIKLEEIKRLTGFATKTTKTKCGHCCTAYPFHPAAGGVALPKLARNTGYGYNLQAETAADVERITGKKSTLTHDLLQFAGVQIYKLS